MEEQQKESQAGERFLLKTRKFAMALNNALLSAASILQLRMSAALPYFSPPLSMDTDHFRYIILKNTSFSVPCCTSLALAGSGYFCDSFGCLHPSASMKLHDGEDEWYPLRIQII